MDARVRRLETECMFAGIGVRVMPSEKPTLADLATTMTDYEWEEGESQNRRSLYQKVSAEKIKEYLHDGIYYTSRKCRALLKKDGGFETTNHSRFVGMLFLDDHYFIAYSVLVRMMRWSNMVETQTAITLGGITTTWHGYEKYHVENEPKAMVVLG